MFIMGIYTKVRLNK